MEMPSLTPIVVKRSPTQPAAATPSLARAARSFRCMLQGLPSYQHDAMPTCALSRSAGVRPVAMSIACDAPWTAGWVILEEYLFSMMLIVFTPIKFATSFEERGDYGSLSGGWL